MLKCLSPIIFSHVSNLLVALNINLYVNQSNCFIKCDMISTVPTCRCTHMHADAHGDTHNTENIKR